MPTRRTPSGQGPRAAPARDLRSRGGEAVRGRSPVRTDGAVAGTRATIRARTGSDAGRSATRPAIARRAASSAAAKRTSAPGSGRFTGRATALGLVLLALMLAYAYPVRLYLDQQAQIQRAEVNQAAQRAAIAHLQSETQKWNDPAYIKAQARARFQMVEPNEKAYIVLPAPAPPTTHPTIPAKPNTTWYGQLWSALRGADSPDGQ